MKVGICAIMKDVFEPYLKEWLNYHREIGVEQFFIYDNDSELSISEMLNGTGYCDDLHIEIVSGKAMQMITYDRCLAEMKAGVLPRCDRLAFIDEDEFIVCEDGDIKKTLEDYADFPALGISWRVFGSSGLKEKTAESQRKKFTQYLPAHYPMSRHIKSIVDPAWTVSTEGNPHSFVYLDGHCVNVNKEPVVGPKSPPVYKKIWLDHYYTRSLAEWREKIARGRSDVSGQERPFNLIHEIDERCGGSKQIHLITPFMRHHLKETLIAAYGPMDVIWHPIVFQNEPADFNEPWIIPYIIPMNREDCKAVMPQYTMRNYWIQNNEIIDEDYYVTVDDDDMYEAGVFDEIKKMNDDIVIISMKRGYNIPTDAIPIRQYPTETLIADPDRICRGGISSQQSFVKGKIFRKHLFDDSSQFGDGDMAICHKQDGVQTAYRPDLFALFNFYEPGRWTKHRIFFGAMVNDLVRLDMCLKQSDLPGALNVVMDPDKATTALNKLLDLADYKGAEIAVLVHQDMYFRNGWMQQVEQQLALLPPDWIVAGIIGKDLEGNICGKFHDMRIAPVFNTSDIHTFPHPASCFDECCIIVNLAIPMSISKTGFRFDEGLDGFDLYGTMAVLQAWEMGGSAWVIDAFAEHYCLRPFTWFPDKDFQARFKWLHERFPTALKIDSTVLAVPNKNKQAA